MEERYTLKEQTNQSHLKGNNLVLLSFLYSKLGLLCRCHDAQRGEGTYPLHMARPLHVFTHVGFAHVRPVATMPACIPTAWLPLTLLIRFLCATQAASSMNLQCQFACKHPCCSQHCRSRFVMLCRQYQVEACHTRLHANILVDCSALWT